MSAYRTLATEMNDLDCLKKALEESTSPRGKKTFQPQVHKEAVALEGYQGDKRKQKAEIVIPRSQVGPSSNDIGFARDEKGNFQALISEYDQSVGYNAKWLDQLRAKYAVAKVKKTAKTIGASLLKDFTRPDGTRILRYAKN